MTEKSRGRNPKRRNQVEEKVPSVISSAKLSRCFSGRAQVRRGRTTSKRVKMGCRKKQGLAKRDQFTSEASPEPRTEISINDAEGMYGAPRRCHGPLKHEVNTRGIGGMRGAGITRRDREICM